MTQTFLFDTQMFRVVFAVLPRHRPRFFSSLSRRIRCAIWCIKNSSSLSCPVVPVWREVTSRKLYPVSTDDRTYANFSLEVFLFSSPSSGVHSTHSCGWRFVVLLPLLSIYFSCFFFCVSHLISSCFCGSGLRRQMVCVVVVICPISLWRALLW